MFIGKLVLVCFSATAIQASLKTNDLPDQEKLPCIRKLNSYKTITRYLQQRYDELYEELKAQKLNSDFLNQLEVNHIDFENKISEALEYYDEGSYLIQLINSTVVRLERCRTYIEMSITTKLRDLKKLILDMEAELTKFLNQPNLIVTNVTEQIRKKFNRIFKMIVIIDMSYEIGKSSNDEYEKNLKEFAAKVKEEVSEELGEKKIGTEAARAAKDRVSEVLQHLESGDEAAAEAAAVIAAEASERAAIDCAEIQKSNDVTESAKTLANDEYWSWVYVRDLMMLIASLRV